jgi:acyl carrier protein
MSHDESELRRLVIREVAEALELDPEEIGSQASLIDDLGAESIDFLDIQFRLEQRLACRFGERRLYEAHIDLSDQRWMVDGVVTPEGRQHLEEAQPQFRWDRLPQVLRTRDLPRLISVDAIVRRLASLIDTPAEVER